MKAHPEAGVGSAFPAAQCCLAKGGHTHTHNQGSIRKEEVRLEEEIPFQTAIRRPLIPVTSKVLGDPSVGGPFPQRELHMSSG